MDGRAMDRRFIIHPGGVVTQSFTTLEEHPVVTTGESLFPHHSSGLQVGSSTDEFTTDHFVTGSSLGPTALVFTDTASDIHTWSTLYVLIYKVSSFHFIP